MGADYEKADETVLTGGSDGGQGANATNYYRPNGSSAGVAVVTRNTRFPTNAVLMHLYVGASGPPGAGETYTYTIMIEGIATAITCQIAGAVAREADDLVNEVAIIPGQDLCVRVVTSLNAVAEQHHWGFVAKT